MADTENTPSAVAEQDDFTPTITDQQLQATLAMGRWQYAQCFECGDKFGTHGAAEMHKGLHDAVLDFYDKGLVN